MPRKAKTHKGLPVPGYVPQTYAAVEAVKVNKNAEELILQRLDELESAGNFELCDQRWLKIARTHIELGFMAMNRAVLKPQRITKKD